MLQRLSASAAAAAARPPKAPKSAKRDRETATPDQAPETKKYAITEWPVGNLLHCCMGLVSGSSKAHLCTAVPPSAMYKICTTLT